MNLLDLVKRAYDRLSAYHDERTSIDNAMRWLNEGNIPDRVTVTLYDLEHIATSVTLRGNVTNGVKELLTNRRARIAHEAAVVGDELHRQIEIDA